MQAGYPARTKFLHALYPQSPLLSRAEGRHKVARPLPHPTTHQQVGQPADERVSARSGGALHDPPDQGVTRFGYLAYRDTVRLESLLDEVNSQMGIAFLEKTERVFFHPFHNEGHILYGTFAQNEHDEFDENQLGGRSRRLHPLEQGVNVRIGSPHKRCDPVALPESGIARRIDFVGIDQ